MEIREFSKEILLHSKGMLLYGAGAWGKLVLETLQSWIEDNEELESKNIPILFIDRLKQNSGFDNIKVINKTEIIKYPEYDILVCAPSAHMDIIRNLQKLREDGLMHVFGISEILKNPTPKTYVNVHDCLSGELLLEKYEYYRARGNQNTQNELPEVVVPFFGVSVTERCSLNCEKCIALVPHYTHPVNYNFEKMKPALGQLVDAVDKILELGFVGGEVFMNKEFYKYLEWAVNEPKIRSITVLTNATLMPDQRTLELLKNKKVAFGIDDYGSLSSKKNELINLAEREDIKYYILYNECWQDIGTLTRKNYSMERRNAIFRSCSFKDCNLFINGKYYRCQHEAHLANLGICDCTDEDCLDLAAEKNVNEIRRRLVALMTKTESLEACDFCNDITQHMFPIPVAKQKIRY